MSSNNNNNSTQNDNSRQPQNLRFPFKSTNKLFQGKFDTLIVFQLSIKRNVVDTKEIEETRLAIIEYTEQNISFGMLKKWIVQRLMASKGEIKAEVPKQPVTPTVTTNPTAFKSDGLGDKHEKYGEELIAYAEFKAKYNKLNKR